MLKGLYINKAGMLPQQKRLEVAANNLANMNTIGYKKESVFFDKLIDAMAGEQENSVITTARIDFSQGRLYETGNPLDVAINGEGFFVIQTEKGEVYTRNGNFTLDSEGRLVTRDGYPVMTDSGEFQITQITPGKVRFTERGEIVVDDQIVGRLKIVTFDDPNLLVRIGNSYFTEGDASEIELLPDEINIRPGYLEGSNVEGIQEMVEMIEINRQYELGQKAITVQDRLLEKLINTAGR